ncbi:uncharacterized protein AAG666_018211 isoform 1-T2 [Megaptera novaeangliae]
MCSRSAPYVGCMCPSDVVEPTTMDTLFWRLGSPGSRLRQIHCLVRQTWKTFTSWFVDGHLLLLYPHTEKESHLVCREDTTGLGEGSSSLPQRSPQEKGIRVMMETSTLGFLELTLPVPVSWIWSQVKPGVVTVVTFRSSSQGGWSGSFWPMLTHGCLMRSGSNAARSYGKQSLF